MYIYKKQGEFPPLYTVGYLENGKWNPVSDHESEEDAQQKIAWLNSKPVDESEKNQFIQKTSIKLIAACVIEDRIAWHRDTCFWSNDSQLIEKSISLAEGLWKELSNKGYV